MSNDILDPTDWMNTDELAKLLGKDIRSMESTRAKGEDHPPYYRVGQRIRYRRSEVAAWLLSKRHVPAVARLAQQETAAA